MGNCTCVYECSKLCFSRPSQKKVILLLLGLENAGKTTVAKGLARELENGVVPTVGFSSVSLTYKKFTVILYDLGGGPGIRAIWQKYFVDAHGIIFVLDSSDIEKVIECRDILKSLLSNDKLSGKPMLVLGNKQDIEGALDEIDIVEILHLEDLVNQQKCPTLVETCSAITLGKPQLKEDPVIQNSFKWLLSLIERDYEQLNSRVERDMSLQREIDQVELNEKLKRVKDARLRKVEGSNGDDNNAHIETNGINIQGHVSDPFRPIAELVKGETENANETDQDSITINLIPTSENKMDTNTNSAVKRLQRQKSICEDTNVVSHKGKEMINCFCVHSHASSVSKLVKCPKRDKTTTARRFSLWRSNRTVPLNGGSKEGGNGEGASEHARPVWAIRLPSSKRMEVTEEGDTHVSVPPIFTVTSQPENTIELEEFGEMAPLNKPGPFQVMKG